MAVTPVEAEQPDCLFVAFEGILIRYLALFVLQFIFQQQRCDSVQYMNRGHNMQYFVFFYFQLKMLNFF